MSPLAKMKFSTGKIFGACVLLVQTFCYGLPGYEAPYYLHFPPIPYNHIEFNGPLPQALPPWLQNPTQQGQNQTLNRNTVTPGPTIGTLQVHLANPPRGNSPPQALNNGTLLYYLSGPWGGIKSIPINQNIDNSITTTPPNWAIPSITPPGSFGFINRDQDQPQTQAPPTNNNNLNHGNYPWNQHNFGWGGWGPSVYDGPSLTTQNPPGSSSPGTVNREQISTTTEGGTTTSTTTEGTTSSTSTNVTSAPSSSETSTDSVTKFRRIVSRIRELAIQELRKP